MVQIRKAAVRDKTAWVDLRVQLWPESNPGELRDDVREILEDANRAAFMAVNEGEVIGFIECSIRDKAPACETDRIGYIEAWFVVPEFRNQGEG